MFSLCLISKVYGCTDFTVTCYFLWLKISVNANKRESESFPDELIGWFSDHQQEIDQLFIRGDVDRSESVSLKDFELGNPSPLPWIIRDGRRLWDFLTFSFFECHIKIIAEEKEIWVSTKCHSVIVLKYLWRVLWIRLLVMSAEPHFLSSPLLTDKSSWLWETKPGQCSFCESDFRHTE